METYVLMLNIDINTVVTPFLNTVAAKPTPKKEDLYPFVDQYADTDITDLLFDVFCQYSAVDSDVFTDYAYKYEQKTENGVAVDYTDKYGALYKLNKTYGIDPYAVWLDRTREMGMRPWISVRMNDCHCPDEDACFLRSEFFYEARENGWNIGDRYGYFRYCFDYAVPEVREKMLAYLREVLDRYDMYGLELDFQRDIYCFDYENNPDCHIYMTEFMRAASALVHAAADKRGHKIVLSARLTRDIAQSKVFGFDVVTWANENLIDLVVPTPRWATNDDDMPIAAWKAALPGVTVQAGLEVLCNRQTFDAAISAEVARSLSAKYLAQGSDGIYLFNHFIGHGASAAQNAQFHEIYNTCGTLEKALAAPSRYVLMWQDTTPIGYPSYRPLPLDLPQNGDARALSLDLGAMPETCSCTLTLGLSGGTAADIAVTVNGIPTAPVHAGTAADIGFCNPGTHLVSYAVIKAENAQYNIRLHTVSGKPVTVTYCDLYVNPPKGDI